jgi:protein TonB
MNNPKPAYPSIAIRRQWEGKVSLKVFVRADGRVGEVLVAATSGHDVLDEAAVEAVRQWRFVPAKRSGQPVDSWVTFPINWNLENSR